MLHLQASGGEVLHQGAVGDAAGERRDEGGSDRCDERVEGT